MDTKRGKAFITRELAFSNLLCSVSQKASKPKDKAYGIYGLCKFLGMAVPDIDYSKPLKMIYQELTQAAIVHNKTLTSLVYICTHKRDDQFPS